MSRFLKVISLFTGAGGLDYGFEKAGYRTVVAVEWDHDSCETLRRNRQFPIIEKSIHDVPTSDILETADLGVGKADILIGGPPCQPFSKSSFWARGDTSRLNDPRAKTLREYLRVLEEVRPATFLLENVEGLDYSGKNDGAAFLLHEIDAINRRQGTRYRPHFQVLCASDYGVPQQRNRFFMVASREGRDFEFPSPTHGSGRIRRFNAWDAIGDLEDYTSKDLEPRGKWAALLPSIPEGSNYLHHTNRGGGIPIFGWRRRYWSFLLKLTKERPSWTIQARPGPAIGPFHWRNRRLSRKEMCRLQTFPDDVEIVGDYASATRQLGNAAPSLLAEILAKEISVQFLDTPVREKLSLLPKRRNSKPGPEPVAAVPQKYLHLAGDHEPHPGTGKGNRAQLWSTAQMVTSKFMGCDERWITRIQPNVDTEAA